MSRKTLRESLSIDLRSLALMRALLGAFVIVDLCRRATDLRAFYTDEGVLPRGAFLDPEAAFHWSLHTLGGSVGFEAALFAIAGLSGLALAVGFQTRVATIVTWVLTISLHNRAEAILISGDRVLRLVLFWSIFLPLGARWSLDARRRRRPIDAGAAWSIAGAALLVQIVVIYPLTVFHKLEHPPWRDMTMVARVLDVDGITSPVGRMMRGLSGLLPAATFLTLVIEALVPFVALFGSGRTRTLATLTMLVFHVVFLGATLYLGLFPFIMIVAWVPFLPAWFWEIGWPRVRGAVAARWPRVERAFGRVSGALDRFDGAAEDAAAMSGARSWHEAAGRAASVATMALAGLAAMDLVLSFSEPRPPAPIAAFDEAIDLLRFDATRGWGLFTNVMNNQYFVYAARLRDGTRVDLHRGAPLDWEHPRDRSENNRWWKYQLHLQDHAATYAPSFAVSVAATWLRDHPEQPIETFDLVVLDRPWNARGGRPLRKVSLWHQEILGHPPKPPAPHRGDDWKAGDRVQVTLVIPGSGGGSACASKRAVESHRCARGDGSAGVESGPDANETLRPFARVEGPPILAAGDPTAKLAPRGGGRVVTCAFEIEGRIPKPEVRWETDGAWFATRGDWFAGAVSDCHDAPPGP